MKKIIFILLLSFIAVNGYSQNTNTKNFKIFTNLDINGSDKHNIYYYLFQY